MSPQTRFGNWKWKKKNVETLSQTGVTGLAASFCNSTTIRSISRYERSKSYNVNVIWWQVTALKPFLLQTCIVSKSCTGCISNLYFFLTCSERFPEQAKCWFIGLILGVLRGSRQQNTLILEITLIQYLFTLREQHRKGWYLRHLFEINCWYWISGLLSNSC